ncbi:MAG TPA: S-adenosylmethionine decarboxylase [Dehalococcoidia bacterium]|nr:S-adenosylmethionine decarboxylase [Dehalococcoidia bacterium]
MHVTIDGFGGDRVRLADDALVRELLDRYPAEIGMTKIAPPHVVRYVGSKPEDWGVSGFVLIAESHISVHTFPERGYIWVDIFSCKNFDASLAIESVRKEFGLERWHTNVLDRGLLEYPHEVEAAAVVSQEERRRVTASVPPGKDQTIARAANR